jgi:hypothetical protein
VEDKPPGQVRRIAIYREEKSLTVAPRQRDADAGDQIVFVNLTQEPMMVSIPDGGLFGGPEVFPVAPDGGSAGPFPVQDSALGGYPYAVYSVATREFAHASAPIIIIFPRT